MECAFYESVKKIAIQSNSLLDYQKGYNNLRDTKILKQGKKINLISQQKGGKFVLYFNEGSSQP